jgi:hypothetical protein
MLDDDAKLVFIFLLSHPHLTAIGAMRASLAGLAAELNWPFKKFVSAIHQLIHLQMVEVNEKANFISLPNFLRYNEPEGPNSVSKAWVESLNLIPECPEKRMLTERCRQYLDTRSDAFRHAMGDGFWDAIRHAMSDGKSGPCHIQEQEQELEQKQEQEQEGGSGGGKKSVSLDPDLATEEWIVEEWSKIDGVKQPLELTALLRSSMRSRTKEHTQREWWLKYLSLITQSDFLTGKTEKFNADLGWAFGPKNMAKVLEGRYANRPETNNSALARIAELEREEQAQRAVLLVNP